MITPLSRWRDGARVEVFTVHEPPDPPADRIDRAELLLFLRDGFTWGAVLLGPLWLALRGAWMALAVYVAALVVLALAMSALGANEVWIVLAALALNVFLGFEAANIERSTLDSSGWAELGTVSGRNMAECERRFFESWLPSQPVIAVRGAARSVDAPMAPASVAARRETPAGPARGWRGLFGSKA